jgi:signal transduction histidine kinase
VSDLVTVGARLESGWLRPVAVSLRWGVLVLGALLAATVRRPDDLLPTLAAGAALVAFAAWRTFDRDLVRSDRAVITETVLTLTAAGATGGLVSPFSITVAVPVLLAGMAWGRAAGAAVVLLTVGVLLAATLGGSGTFDPADLTQVLLVSIVAAAVVAVAHGLVAEAEEEHERTLGRIQQLGSVNALLSTLHDLVRSMPAPLSVEEIVRVIRGQLDELFEADVVVLLMHEGGGRMRPVYSEGTRVVGQVSVESMPPQVRDRGPTTRPVMVTDLGEDGGLWPDAACGAYLWLFSRGNPIGLLALEHGTPGAVQQDEDQRDTLERLSIPLSLAIDNALWFQRLRTLGAEEERQRIGAELHDRFAQSLAYVAMELDRTVRAHPDDDGVARLREEVRATLADLRETLRELRLSVTDARDLPAAIGEHLERFGERFGVLTELQVRGDDVRLSLPVEQQLLRIVQDLTSLAQRHGAATRLTVVLDRAPGRVRMSVEDDGRGTAEDELGAEARHVLDVVRERADAVGATVDVASSVGRGTAVHVTLRGML